MAEKSNLLSRRDFLKRAAVGTAGIAAASVLGPCAAEAVAAPQSWDYETDVVVIGSGAGLVAACQAADKGAEVILVEKSNFLGGESALNEGVIQAVGTRLQEKHGIVDSPETFLDDFKAVTGAQLDFMNMDYADLLANRSGEALNRLEDFGCEFILKQDVYGMGTIPRTHLLQPNAGAWRTVLGKAAEDRGVKIMTATAFTDFITAEDGSVIGIVAGGKTFKARKAVILATGDASANKKLVARYNPSVSGMYAASAGNTGDGLFAALKLGADCSFDSTGPVTIQFTAPEGTFFTSTFVQKGMIQVNSQGKRFGNELDFAAMSVAQLEQPDAKCYAIFDSRLANLTKRPDADIKEWAGLFASGKLNTIAMISGLGGTFLEDFMERGIIVQADTLEELAQKMGIDGAGLKEQVSKWNAATLARTDDEFGRPIVDPVYQYGEPVTIEEGPFYGVYMKTVPLTIMMDGPNLIIDTDMRVLNTEGNPIPRLYAAGAGVCAGPSVVFLNGCGVHMMFTALSAMIAADNAVAETSV